MVPSLTPDVTLETYWTHLDATGYNSPVQFISVLCYPMAILDRVSTGIIYYTEYFTFVRGVQDMTVM